MTSMSPIISSSVKNGGLVQACHWTSERARSGFPKRLPNVWCLIPSPAPSCLYLRQDWLAIISVHHFIDLFIWKMQNSRSSGRQNYALLLFNTNQGIMLELPSFNWIHMLSSGLPPECGPGRSIAQRSTLVSSWTSFCWDLCLFSCSRELS